MNVNKVFLGGRLTRDVEVKRPADQALATFGLAVNRKYTMKNGEQREEVVFVDVEAWGRTAEIMAEHLHKGSPVFVEGRLRFSRWEADGQNRSKLSVVVEHFQFLGGGKAREQSKKQATA